VPPPEPKVVGSNPAWRIELQRGFCDGNNEAEELPNGSRRSRAACGLLFPGLSTSVKTQ
jgi:hypothetical protein